MRASPRRSPSSARIFRSTSIRRSRPRLGICRIPALYCGHSYGTGAGATAGPLRACPAVASVREMNDERAGKRHLAVGAPGLAPAAAALAHRPGWLGFCGPVLDRLRTLCALADCRWLAPELLQLEPAWHVALHRPG